MNRSTQKLLVTLLKLVIAVYTVAYVYYKIFVGYTLDYWVQEYRHTVAGVNWVLVALATVLLLANWGLEAVKWRYLMRAHESVSLWLALKAVFSGTTISLITPNRIGEYAGRVVHLEKSDKVQAAFTTMVGSLSQLCVTVLLGCLCFMLQLDVLLPQYNLTSRMVILMCTVVMLLSLVLYYNMWVLGAVTSRFPLLHRFNRYLHVFEQYDMGQLTHVLLFSAVRYAVFTLQYLLLIHAFHVSISSSAALLMIPVIFLAQSLLPSFALTELGMRGPSAVFFFSLSATGLSQAGIMLSAYSLWIINLIFPSLLGLILLLRVRFSSVVS